MTSYYETLLEALWTVLLWNHVEWCFDYLIIVITLVNLKAQSCSVGGGTAQKTQSKVVAPIFREPELGFPPVEPLQNFNWQTTEPLKLRPFKAKYFLTMALETASVSDLIQIDKDFFSRLALRKQILSTSLQSALRASPAAHPAIAELYTFLVTTYLPTRFPSIFRLVPPSLKNLVSNETYPLQCPDHPLQALQTLGTLVDEDFMFLLPAPDGDGYTLQAYTVCYASGFAMERLFAAKLRDIHAEVPGYKDRLQTSMDRWFARLEAGRFVRRTNWTITMSGQLRNAHGENQIYSDSGASSAEAPAADIDISNAHLRTERQHVFRLPRTGAIVFAFKTYLYPLADVKVEGNGEALAAAVEGLKTGNVPEMARYKGANRWGEKVVQFLRAGSGEGDA